ncbi:acetyl-CoA synthetase-like protein [Corynespora cassiicola Philippines]|uniref:Acetyl-CoA synthetase-like protein n=1 Tax=Corynespora cassiicola Philippines TaxID=1448308 RepID=A0A2T2N8Y5_CORCC|nr:acetyl-CoA synthetase-like protein [Corynespora cassiicola Philippines]
MEPVYGKRLMPAVVDETARENPGLVYASVPLSTNIGDGFKNITFSDIASATNHVAAWIEKTMGRSSEFETIAYMGLGDLRYVVVFLAAVKCGYKVLLPSLRNSTWMNTSLLEQTKCTRLLFAPEVESFVKPLLGETPHLSIHPIEPLETLIRPDTPHYVYDKQYDLARWDPILVLHSSGSTGPPRPIVMNHNTFAVGDNDRNLPTVPGRVNQNWSLWDFPEKESFFSPFPAFHLAGFSSMVTLPIYYSNATLILPPSTRPPSGHLVSEIMDHFKLKSIFCPPIIAEQLVQEPSGLEKCKSLKFLLYAGGPLSQAAGEALSKVTDVCQFYGSTETGPVQALVPRREDWASLEWHPRQEVTMDPSIEGMYEMILKHNPSLEGVRSISCNFPDVEVWRTKDLFKPHPTKEGLWKFHGRSDDIIVLSNGEKFNPVPSEVHISSHPLLSGALIIGQGYPQASLVLEPKDHQLDPVELIDRAWPTIEKANSEAPAHARLTRDMIIVGTKDRLFDRAAKGTVVRKSSSKKYEKDVSELYTREISKNLQHISLAPSSDLAMTSKFVADVIHVAFPGHMFTPEDDLFVMGLDSLQTTEIISLLKAGIQSNSDDNISWVTAKFVYEHPTISSLSSAIFQHLDSKDVGTVADKGPSHRSQKMEQLVENYTQNLPEPQDKTPSAVSHVILTGTTGSLGTQILAKLLADPNISRISCFDRSSDAGERVTKSLSSWSSPPILDLNRVSFHQVDYGKKDFGLESQVCLKLKETVSVIIHNAWKVDFNHSLDSFEAVHIRGVRNFIDFAGSSSMIPRVVFISSISSVGNWADIIPKDDSANSKAIIPEAIPPTPAVAQPIGYAESKAVAEQILAKANLNSKIPVSIFRIGQIAGPVSAKNGGCWNEHEWFPLLLKTSKALGELPAGETFDSIDWVPMDVLATIILELIISSSSSAPALQVRHIVNPTVRPWDELLPAVQGKLGVDQTMRLEEWVEELEKVDLKDKEAVARLPAVKILDFFREMVNSMYAGAKNARFSTLASQDDSLSLKALEPVKKEWIEKWIGQWGF